MASLSHIGNLGVNNLLQNRSMAKPPPPAIRAILCSLLAIFAMLPAAGCRSMAARQKKIAAYEASGKCFNCKGSGEVECPQCKGRGWITCARCSGSGRNSGVPATGADPANFCSACQGHGQLACPNCDGFSRLSCDRCGGSGIAPKKTY